MSGLSAASTFRSSLSDGGAAPGLDGFSPVVVGSWVSMVDTPLPLMLQTVVMDEQELDAQRVGAAALGERREMLKTFEVV